MTLSLEPLFRCRAKLHSSIVMVGWQSHDDINRLRSKRLPGRLWVWEGLVRPRLASESYFAKCGESIRMQQKYFLFLKIISIVPLPGWKPRWALGYRWWWGTWNLEVRSNSKVPGQGRARVRQGQTTAIQARGWGHAFPPYIVPSPKLLAPITKPLLSCNQKSGYVIPPPVLILDTKPLP